MVGPGLGAGLTQAAFRLFWITMDIVPGVHRKNKWAKQKKRKRKKVGFALRAQTWIQILGRQKG